MAMSRSPAAFKLQRRLLSIISAENIGLQLQPTAVATATSTAVLSKPTPPPLLPCATADNLSQLLIRHHNPFHAMESPLQLAGVSLTPDLFLQTLLRLRNASKVALAFFVWARDHAHHRPSAAAYDLMIDILGRVRQFDVVWQLIVEMDQGSGEGEDGVSVRTFAVLVRRYVAAGMTRLAIRAFDDMEAFVGREGDRDDFHMLLDTLCKYGYAKVATDIFNKRKFKYEPDEKSYSILIYGWCKVNKHEMAQKFLKEMIDRGLEPNGVTYNILLNGMCRKPFRSEYQLDRIVRAAEELLNEMRSKGIEPDITSYSIILHCYTRANKPELSLYMFRSMQERGICPSVATYTSVIKCLSSSGRLEDAEKLINEMIQNGVCPPPAAFNCFFKEFKGRKDVQSAITLYKNLKGMESLCRPDIHTYNILLRMFSALNHMPFIREVWNDMSESGVGPDLDSYTLLIHGLCQRQKWRLACHYFMEMIEKGFLPQKVTFETLYRGLIQANMLRTWRRLKNKVEEESLKFGAEFQRYHLKPYKR